MIEDALENLARLGRMLVLDLVRAPSLEARLAFPELVRDVVQRAGGKLRFGASIDQQVIGQGLDTFQDLLVTEYPSGEACVRALLERRAWQPETFVDEIATWAARPWPGTARIATRAIFGIAGALTRSPALYTEADAPKELLDEAGQPCEPDADQVRALSQAERDGPVVMVNYLRYSPSAESKDEPPSGAEAYQAYGRNTVPLIGSLGGHILFNASKLRIISGDPEAPWNDLVIVHYPSRAAFIGMFLDPRYRKGLAHRRAGLDSTRLLACTPHAAFA